MAYIATSSEDAAASLSSFRRTASFAELAAREAHDDIESLLAPSNMEESEA